MDTPPLGKRPGTVLAELRAELRLSRDGLILVSVVVAVMGVIGALWWPHTRVELAKIDWSRPLWRQMDWLLAGIYSWMFLSITCGARLRKDAQLAFVALWGGLVIESWGTQTQLWKYYTRERPPLWIIPAWPIATLASDRIVRLLDRLAPESPRAFRAAYWLVFPAYYALMLQFVWPTLDKPLTAGALVLCALLLCSPPDRRLCVLIFAAGTGLGYFLERWGTTRGCWIYYTRGKPPLFSVFAHGMATLAFWRAALLLRSLALRGRPDPDPIYRAGSHLEI